jgi:hypothetical protein
MKLTVHLQSGTLLAVVHTDSFIALVLREVAVKDD